MKRCCCWYYYCYDTSATDAATAAAAAAAAGTASAATAVGITADNRWPRVAMVQWNKITYIDLAYFGGHRRCILPSLSPSQPVIDDGEIIFPDRSLELGCWRKNQLHVMNIRR